MDEEQLCDSRPIFFLMLAALLIMSFICGYFVRDDQANYEAKKIKLKNELRNQEGGR